MNYTIGDISRIVRGDQIRVHDENMRITSFQFDSRKITFPDNACFICFPGQLNDGHDFIPDAYEKGVRTFLVSKHVDIAWSDVNIIRVADTLKALQTLAETYRQKLSGLFIGITGSNGKTILKEWLFHALIKAYSVGKSPKSYNSGIGVPLSVLGIDPEDDIAIIEAGISKRGEMVPLERIIRPDIGVMTNIGDAHSSGFDSKNEKLQEKLKLFSGCQTVVYCEDHEMIREALSGMAEAKKLSWGHADTAQIRIIRENPDGQKTTVTLEYNKRRQDYSIPFIHAGFVENAKHFMAILILLGFPVDFIQDNLDALKGIEMRLEVKKGIRHSLLINDSYSADLSSLKLALEFLVQQAGHKRKILILSDFDQQKHRPDLHKDIAQLIRQADVNHFICVGENIVQVRDHLDPGLACDHFISAHDLKSALPGIDLAESVILVKGARRFHLESIFETLSGQVHQTILEINLTSVGHNINAFKQILNEKTRMMAVLKASAYGSGSNELARYLQSKKVDYISVALVDEAIDLRKAQCTLPIMVLNADDTQIHNLWAYRIEPEVYSMKMLEAIIDEALVQNDILPIHLKVDTGMNRLGFKIQDIEPAIEKINDCPHIRVGSVFSHLAASEDPRHDAYTRQQAEDFERAYEKIASLLGYQPLKHILNTSGIIRFPQYQYDMVRLGLGLYGEDSTHQFGYLEKALALKARVLQVRAMKKGDTTGYGRDGKMAQDGKIAVIGIGYADGLFRSAGNGRFSVLIHNKPAPTIGNICMDVTMVDVTDIDNVNEGDEVVIFDHTHPIGGLAKACHTIPYEIISRLAPRVKRMYVYT